MNAILKKSTFTFAFLFIFLSMEVQAQWNKEFPVLGHYWKWGVTAGPALFTKAKIEPQSGSQSFGNKPTVSFNAGVEYTFFADRRWSFLTGLLVSREPAYNIDLQVGLQDWSWKVYTFAVNFSVPLIAQMQMQVGEKVFLNLSAGYKAMYMVPAGYGYGAGSNLSSEDKEEFSLSLETPDNYIHGSAVFGVGTTLAMKPFLLKINLIYNMYFQNIVTGGYRFNDLENNVSSSVGTYKLSGNYLGLMVSFYLKKPQKKQ